MSNTGAKRTRGGIAVRIDITGEEHRDLKILAARRGSTVPKIIAEQVRNILGRAKKS